MDQNNNTEQTPREYPADKARQGEIILKARWQRVLFISGFVGIVVLALVLQLIGGQP
jgi:hypothetical protein